MLLGPGNIGTHNNWVSRARIWQLVLLMDQQGFWDPGPGVAFATSAVKLAPAQAQHLTRKELGTLRSAFVSAALAATDGNADRASMEVVGLSARDREARISIVRSQPDESLLLSPALKVEEHVPIKLVLLPPSARVAIPIVVLPLRLSWRISVL